MRVLVAALLLFTTLSGCAEAPEAASGREAEETPHAGEAHAVILVHDSGFNPYHVAFRDDSPRAFQHPSTYLPGYPAEAIALNITLDAPDYDAALRADCDLWANVTYGQQYWFPGTKVISAISFSNVLAGIGGGSPPFDCRGDSPVIGYLGGSHGTMTSSRAASIEYGACKRCLVGMVVNYNIEGVEWIGQQGAWADVQSNSWGPVAPVFVPASETGVAPLLSDPEFNEAVEASAQEVLSFWASGNGAATRGGVLGHPTFLTPHFGPSVIIVGGHDSGYINTWPGFTPHVISDSCKSWAAHHESLDGSDDSVGGGTSGATPFSAGIAADILLEARLLLGDLDRSGRVDGVMAAGDAGNITSGPLADGAFTVDEWRDVLYKTATARPQRQYEDGADCTSPVDTPYGSLPVAWKDIPEDVPAYPYVGYGATDNESRELAFAVLRGDAPMPERSAEDAYFAAYEPMRAAVNNLARGNVGP